MEDAGPLATAARYGLHLRLLEAFRPDGTPLGEVWSRTWARDEVFLAVPQVTKRKARKAAPIEDKESFRWLDGLRPARAFADQCPGTTCAKRDV